MDEETETRKVTQMQGWALSKETRGRPCTNAVWGTWCPDNSHQNRRKALCTCQPGNTVMWEDRRIAICA